MKGGLSRHLFTLSRPSTTETGSVAAWLQFRVGQLTAFRGSESTKCAPGIAGFYVLDCGKRQCVIAIHFLSVVGLLIKELA